jgi:4-amino-4-deoxy-L-arabinose transferase-like glycosyltransferase
MWARLVVAPWWVLWLVNAALFAAALIAICALGLPGFTDAGWIWPLVSVVGFSLIATALTTIAQRPVQQSYAPAIAGLSLPQRSQAAKALRRGEIPSDPRVLAAAIRVGNLSLAYRRTGVPAYRRTGVPAYRRTGVGFGIVGRRNAAPPMRLSTSSTHTPTCSTPR